jgi:hypothetical protein
VLTLGQQLFLLSYSIGLGRRKDEPTLTRNGESMKPTQNLILALALSLIPTVSLAKAKAVPPPTHLKAMCAAFTWSDTDGSSGTIYPGTIVNFEIGKRVELFRTSHAIYQAVVSPAAPEKVFLDVLDLAEKRIAGASDSIAFGPSVAEPGVNTQFVCYKSDEAKALKRAK